MTELDVRQFLNAYFALAVDATTKRGDCISIEGNVGQLQKLFSA
jgi:hypothetical protein